MPHLNTLGLSMSPANQGAGEPVVRAGFDRTDCVVDATSIKRPGAGLPETCALIGGQFHTVPARGGRGCPLYMHDVSSRVSAAPRRNEKCRWPK